MEERDPETRLGSLPEIYVYEQGLIVRFADGGHQPKMALGYEAKNWQMYYIRSETRTNSRGWKNNAGDSTRLA